MTYWMLLSYLYLFVVRMLRLERFTYLGRDIHVSANCESEVNRRLGRAWGVVLLGPVQEDNSPSLQVIGASGLAR